MKNQATQLPWQDFTALYREIGPKILRHVMRLCANKDVAEEILQETILAMYTHRHSFQGRSSVATWAYRIATNKWIDHSRRAWNKVRFDSPFIQRAPDCGPSPEQQVIMNEDGQKLRQALDQLPPEQKAALYLVRFEGLKYREAAEILKVSLSTVRMRVYYGLLALKRSLGESQNEE